MQQSGFKYSKFLKSGALALSLMIVSACQSATDVDNYLAGAGTYQISAPTFDSDSEQEALKASRIRVSSIEVSAPG